MTVHPRLRTGLLAALAAGAVLATQVTLAAAPSPQSAIPVRQAGFKKMGAATKLLKDQIASGAPVKATVVGAAQTIAAIAREQARLFPAGSGPAPGVKTDALPAIWTDRATFDAQMTKLAVESGKLVAVANGGDTAAITAQFKATGAVCGGCHRLFRADS